MIKRLWTLLAFLIAVAGAASAHDVWMTTAPGGADGFKVLVHYGHPGDTSLPDPGKLFGLAVRDHQGQTRDINGHLLAGSDQTQAAVVTGMQRGPDTAIFYAAYDNGCWVKTRDGVWHNTSRENLPDAVESSRILKFGKYLASPDPASAQRFDTVIGQRLELVPLQNPFIVKPHEKLRVRVLFADKPLENAGVECGDGVTPHGENDLPLYRTDRNGVAEVPLGGPGLVLLAVDYKGPFAYPTLAEKESISATLAFKH